MLHTHDPEIANSPEFANVLRDAKAVWFNGGRQWNLVDSYGDTLTEREFFKVLERGGVIGGSSAGATIQGQFLVRGAVQGPELVIAPEPEHRAGFAFLKRSAIDQHINTRNRWDDIVPLIKQFPDLLGIGLSEKTAIVVNGDRFEVIGAWKVAVHDNTRLYQPWEKPYFVLSAGDVYNMKNTKGRGTGHRYIQLIEIEPAERLRVGPHWFSERGSNLSSANWVRNVWLTTARTPDGIQDSGSCRGISDLLARRAGKGAQRIVADARRTVVGDEV
jgi:cyanophycinase